MERPFVCRLDDIIIELDDIPLRLFTARSSVGAPCSQGCIQQAADAAAARSVRVPTCVPMCVPMRVPMRVPLPKLLCSVLCVPGPCLIP